MTMRTAAGPAAEVHLRQYSEKHAQGREQEMGPRGGGGGGRAERLVLRQHLQQQCLLTSKPSTTIAMMPLTKALLAGPNKAIFRLAFARAGGGTAQRHR
jgi:hypothetical protein